MARCPRKTLLGTMLLLAGCLEQVWAELEPFLATDTDTSAGSSSSSTSPGTTDAWPTDGIQTVTGPPSESTSTTGTTTTTAGPLENLPPTVDLVVSPDHLDEAGAAQLLLTASLDVVKVRLAMDGVMLAELTAADFPYTYEALSAKDNGLPHVFTAEVEDAEGLTATDAAELKVQLPPSGAERCLFADTSAPSMISALVYTDAAIVAAGWRDTGVGPRATIWKLDPDHCEVVLPGWPKSIANWSGDVDLAAAASFASAIAVDETGHLAVGVTVYPASKPQRYVAFMTPGGSLLWEKRGKVDGEEVAGVAITPDAVIAVGWAWTNENPLRTDAKIWRHLQGGEVWQETLTAPFTGDELPDPNNQLSEWARAIFYDGAAETIVIVGDREFRSDDLHFYRRAFVAQFAPLGGKSGEPWTSSGEPFKRDGATSVARCGAELLVGGWTQDTPPGSLSQPLTRWLAADGTADMRVMEALPNAQTLGIACDREEKVIHAATRSVGQVDARVFAFADPNAPRLWYEQGSAGGDAAYAIDCDGRGFCTWGGYRTISGQMAAVVRGHHP